jgi:hypothetical protein
MLRQAMGSSDVVKMPRRFLKFDSLGDHMVIGSPDASLGLCERALTLEWLRYL